MRKHFDGQVVSTDDIRVAFKSVTNPEHHPDLFDKIVDPISEDMPSDKKIARLRRRDDQVWAFMKEFLRLSMYSHDDILTEGCYWPSTLRQLDSPHKAVFLVDTSATQVERLIQIRETSERNNWMRDAKFTDEKMKAWADFNRIRSEMIIRECQEYKYPCYDIATYGIDGVQSEARQFLDGNNVANLL